jgi:hypothetical protein
MVGGVTDADNVSTTRTPKDDGSLQPGIPAAGAVSNEEATAEWSIGPWCVSLITNWCSLPSWPQESEQSPNAPETLIW